MSINNIANGKIMALVKIQNSIILDMAVGASQSWTAQLVTGICYKEVQQSIIEGSVVNNLMNAHRMKDLQLKFRIMR